MSQTGSTTKLPVTNAGWDTEILLDVEWAHANAFTPKSCWSRQQAIAGLDLLAAVNYAKSQPAVNVVDELGRERISPRNKPPIHAVHYARQPSRLVCRRCRQGGWGSPLVTAISLNVLALAWTTLNLTAGALMSEIER